MNDDDIDEAAKNSALRKITRGAGVVFLGTFLQLGIAFFAKALMARELEVAQYGSVSLGILVANVGATIALLGLDTGVARYIPRYDDARKRFGVFLSSYQVAIPASLLATAGFYLAAPMISRVLFRDPSVTPVVQMMAFGIPFWVTLDLGVGVTRGREQASPRIVAKNVTLPATRFLFVAIAAVLGLGAVGMATAYIGSYAVAALVMTGIILFAITRQSESLLSAERMHRPLVVFSLPLMFSGFSSFLMRNIDLLFISNFQGTAAVGIYNVVYPTARLLNTAMGGFGFLFLPVISRLHSDGKLNEAERVLKITAKWLTLISLPLFAVFLIFPGEVIKLFFTAKYIEGALTIQVLAVGFFVSNPLETSNATLQSVGRPRLVLYIQVVATAINLVLNFALIPTLGYLGAGIATTVAYLTRGVLGTIVIYYLEGIHPLSSSLTRPVVIASLLMVVIYTIVELFLTVTLPVFVVVSIAFGIAYVVAVLRFGGIEDEDVMIFNAIEERSGVNLDWLRRMLRRYMD